MRQHAVTYWAFDKKDADLIEMSKLDVAVDTEGAFMPLRDTDTRQMIKYLLQQQVEKLFTNHFTNFLHRMDLSQLKVKVG